MWGGAPRQVSSRNYGQRLRVGSGGVAKVETRYPPPHIGLNIALLVLSGFSRVSLPRCPPTTGREWGGRATGLAGVLWLLTGLQPPPPALALGGREGGGRPADTPNPCSLHPSPPGGRCAGSQPSPGRGGAAKPLSRRGSPGSLRLPAPAGPAVGERGWGCRLGAAVGRPTRGAAAPWRAATATRWLRGEARRPGCLGWGREEE